jgi:hypothetical protein
VHSVQSQDALACEKSVLLQSLVQVSDPLSQPSILPNFSNLSPQQKVDLVVVNLLQTQETINTCISEKDTTSPPMNVGSYSIAMQPTVEVSNELILDNISFQPLPQHKVDSVSVDVLQAQETLNDNSPV